MTKHEAIHKLVHAIRALNEADNICTNAAVTEHIRWARALIWQAGEDIGVDIAGQLKKANETN
jgi:hypothetical protein